MSRHLPRLSPTVWIAVVYLLVMLVLALLAPQIAPYDPNEQRVGPMFGGLSAQHWLGTDGLGRDVASRLIFGARLSMSVTVRVLLIVLAVAVPIGLVAGYFSGRLDDLLMRLVDMLISFPPLVLALAVAGVLGPGANNVVIALSIILVPTFIRIVRGRTLAVREETFVEASRAIGTRTTWILRKRVLPNVTSPLIVQAAISSGTVLLAEASLSFLGIGARPPDASWGGMLGDFYDVLLTRPWYSVAPGAVIALTVLAFNTVGEGLRHSWTLQAHASTGTGIGGAGLGMTQVEPSLANASSGRENGARQDALLRVEGLTVAVRAADSVTLIPLVRDVSFSIRRGEVLGLVGESGSGKTVTSLSIMRLLPSPPLSIVSGHVWLGGMDLLELDFNRLRRIRGTEVGMIFQDPLPSLNPAFTIREQITEAISWHEKLPRRVQERRVSELLEHVGIPARRGADYPHQFSGGMCQRVMIAMALAGRPSVLIADEPTTALDMTVQAQIIDLLRSVQKELGMAMLFVTHDLGLVAEFCDRVMVMYAGEIIEEIGTGQLWNAALHPYTRALLASLPQEERLGVKLSSIPGSIASAALQITGCRFYPRCEYAEEGCRAHDVELRSLDGGRVRCRRAEEIRIHV